MIPMQPRPDDPVRVIVESSGPDWWEIVASLGPLGILTAAIITGIIGWRSLRHSRRSLEQKIEADRLTLEQKALADQKNQWWERVQWALDSSFSEDPDRQAAGIAMLRVLSEADWLTDEEVMLLDAAWREELEDDDSDDDETIPGFLREELAGWAIDVPVDVRDNGDEGEGEETGYGQRSTR